jgi:tetratricopeptide (TPR) repeat protein
MPDLDSSKLSEEGKHAFEKKQFDLAADLFRQAADGFTQGRAGLSAAEEMNNLSVALLQAGKYQGALDASLGTDEVFASANDPKRQAIALANQAAAMEALHRYDEAMELYERAAEIFAGVGEGDMRAMVMKAGAALKLKTGRVTDSAFKMMGALEAKEKPSLFERILRFFLRIKR